MLSGKTLTPPPLTSSLVFSRPRARTAYLKLASLLAALTVAAAGLAAIAASQPATAQVTALDPDLCATTYQATGHHGPLTEADCRTMVAWRNTVMSNPDSIIPADHQMALWGSENYREFNRWPGLGVFIVDGQRVLHSLKLPGEKGKRLAGPLPGRLPHIRFINLPKNYLTGGLPAWIYGASDLTYLALGTNRLSGTVTGSAFRTPALWGLLLENNQFSGSVPNFNFDALPELVDLRISNNNFSGPFPAGYSGLADGRGVHRLQFHTNKITGDLPGWVSNLKFRNTVIWGGVNGRHYIDFTNNNLCIPNDFSVPTYKKLDGGDAPVDAEFYPNSCPTGQPITATDKIQNLQFQTVDASGNPTSDNPVGLKVTWSRASTATGSKDYSVGLRLVLDRENIYETRDYRYDHCLAEHITPPSIQETSPNNFEVTITRSHCSITEQRTLFDPRNYLPSVSVGGAASQTGDTRSSGEERVGASSVWSVYIADDARKTYRDVIAVMNTRDIWRWDAANQIWQAINAGQPNLDSFNSLNLDPGSSLAIETRVPNIWLPKAGLSTADADTPVQLQNGWNVISAGGSATRGGNDNGAFFIDDSLIDCSSTNGAIAIMRHVAGTQRFDVELPCHPGREASMTRGQAFRTIGEINELDTLFIYFRSALPVKVSWDADNSRYAPTS